MSRLAGLLMLGAAPAAAQAGPLTGAWCGDDFIYIDADHIDLGRNISCTTVRPLSLAGITFESAMDCTAVYVTSDREVADDAPLDIDVIPLPELDHIALTRSGDDSLIVITPEYDAPQIYRRCD